MPAWFDNNVRAQRVCVCKKPDTDFASYYTGCCKTGVTFCRLHTSSDPLLDKEPFVTIYPMRARALGFRRLLICKLPGSLFGRHLSD
jgi:hypothetical protein